MTLSTLGEILAMAKQWPSAATMIAVTLMASWIIWAETGHMAKADDLESVKKEFTEIVNQKVEPLNAGFKVIIRANIDSLSDQITRLEYKRDQPPPNDWTEEDEFAYRGLLKQRATQQAALDQMIQSGG